MDNKNQQNDNRSLIKKLALPLAFLVGGLVVFVVLYKLLLSNKIQLPGADSAATQESFQAPAEISTTLQIECQTSVDKIDRLSSCEDQQTEFLSKVNSCANYSYSLDSPASMNSDGQYADIVFNIATCYKKLGGNSVAQAVSLLKKIETEIPPWDVNLGPITCDSKSALRAYLDAYSTESSFVCTKASDIGNLVQQLQSKNVGLIKQLVWSNHIPELGLRDSDVSCPEGVNEITSSLLKALNQSNKVGINNSEQKTDSSFSYVEISKNTDLMALLKIGTNPDGCLYLDSLLVSNLDGVE